MIVSCPSCSSKYRVRDESVATTGAKMKCPKCGQLFLARTPGASAPNPISFDEPSQPPVALAQPSLPPAPLSLEGEWNARVDSDHAAENVTDALRELFPEPMSSPPRDPFYEDSPRVEERAPGNAPPRPVDVARNAPPTAPESPLDAQPMRPAASDDDPFANINLTVPTHQPLPGGNQVDPRVPGVPAPSPTEASATAPEAPAPARPSASGIVLREQDGAEHKFRYLPQARDFIDAHPAPQQLTVSIAGSAFTPVTLARVFAGLNLDRSPAPSETSVESIAGDSTPTKELAIPAPLPPTPAPPPRAKRAPLQTARKLIPRVQSRFLSGLSVFFLIISCVYSAWQFALVPLDPHLTQLIVKLTGASSPRLVPEPDGPMLASQERAAAREANQDKRIGQAILHYRRALLYAPEDREVIEELAACYQQLGDVDAARDLRRVHGVLEP